MEVQFLEKYLHKSMEIDALLSSRPLIQEAEDPGEICELFDIISSGKGASIFRMLENTLGLRFKRGFQKYVKSHMYGGAVTEDLWSAIESFTTEKIPVRDIMDTWTRQMGYPLLTVQQIDNVTYRVTQERFLVDRNNLTAETEGSRWSIPVTWTCSIDKDHKMMEWIYQERFH